MKLLVAFCMMAGIPAWCEIHDVLKDSRIHGLLARAGQPLAVHQRSNFAIVLRADQGTPRESRHTDADEVWFVRQGSAALLLNGKPYRIAAGDVVYAPRNTVGFVDPGNARLETIVVRVFPSGTEAPPTFGGLLAQRRMPDVVKKSEIDQTFATHDQNQPLHAGLNFTLNYVIYPAHPGPWEAHRGCVDIYFLQMGTAQATIGGQIANAKEESPGEIRGSGVSGGKRHRIGPGDIVLIPRDTAHHIDPGPGKLGYLLLKVWAE